MTVEVTVAEIDDAAGILAIYAPYCESTFVSFEVVAPTLTQMQERIERITNTYPWLVAEISGHVAGYVYATQLRERAAYQWAAEVAVYVDPKYQRRGLARILYNTLFTILRGQGFFKAYASITLPNGPSETLHEHLGFESVGLFTGVGHKAGTWLNVGWWQKQLQPEIPDPPTPKPFRTFREAPLIEKALSEARRQANSPG